MFWLLKVFNVISSFVLKCIIKFKLIKDYIMSMFLRIVLNFVFNYRVVCDYLNFGFVY